MRQLIQTLLLGGLLLSAQASAQDMNRISLQWQSHWGAGKLHWQPALQIGQTASPTLYRHDIEGRALDARVLRLPLSPSAYRLNAMGEDGGVNWLYVVAAAAVITAVAISVSDADDEIGGNNSNDGDQPSGCNGVSGTYNVTDPTSSEPVILGPDCNFLD